MHRHTEARKITQRRQALLDPVALRERIEEWARLLVLCLHPLSRRRRVELLEPAVGIGDARSEVIVHHAAARRGRILPWAHMLLAALLGRVAARLDADLTVVKVTSAATVATPTPTILQRGGCGTA